MTLPWIKITKRLNEAIKLINTTPNETYLKILTEITKPHKNDRFTDSELEDLQKSLKLTPDGVQMLVQGVSHLFKQSSKIILKPTTLQKNLTEILRLDADKAEEFVKAWSESAREEFGDLDRRKKLDDVDWQLNVESDVVKGQVIPNARLQLRLSDLEGGKGENVTLDFNEDQLMMLYSTLEMVQSKLDSIQGSK